MLGPILRATFTMTELPIRVPPHQAASVNGRQRIFHDESDYQRLWQGLAQTLDRFGLEITSVACMPNHIHVFLRTPEPNLSRGMQHLFSGYVNWFSTRHRRPGHSL